MPRSGWKDKHPYRVAWGIVDLSHPIFNFRGEYDKLDEYDGQVGGEGINDTRIMSMEARVRQRSKVDSRRTMDGDGTRDAWRGRGE